jgi:hypothetical protein
MKTYGSTASPFLTSALHGSQWSASRRCRFTPEEIAPGTHLIGSLEGPRAGLGAVERKIILYCQGSNPGRPARSPSLYRLSYPDAITKYINI